jgi:hypothetical protein
MLELLQSKTMPTTNIGEDMGRKDPSYIMLVGM